MYYIATALEKGTISFLSSLWFLLHTPKQDNSAGISLYTHLYNIKFEDASYTCNCLTIWLKEYLNLIDDGNNV